MVQNAKKVFKQFCIKAFTLAEVLIVIGVVGIIAEMTIPSMVQSFEKQQTASQLSKAYTTIAEAIKLSEIDNGNNGTWSWHPTMEYKEIFDKYFAPYLKVSKVCVDADGYYEYWCLDGGYESGEVYWLKGHPAGYAMHFSGASLFTWWDAIQVYLADGSTMFLTSFGSSMGGLTANEKNIIVDVNGAKAPNRVGRDIFLFVIDANRGLMPVRYNSTSAQITLYCKDATGAIGASCAAKIMRDGWQIKDDYPWDIVMYY